MSKKLKLTAGYSNTDFTRQYTINDVEESVVSGIKGRILAVNASLAGGTSDGLNNFFRSDDYDSDEGIGSFTRIVAAQLEEKTETVINLDEEGGE